MLSIQGASSSKKSLLYVVKLNFKISKLAYSDIIRIHLCHFQYQERFCNTISGLQITVGHRTMADQNWPMSNKITTLVGYFVRPIFCCNIWLYHLQFFYATVLNVPLCLSHQIFLLSDQNVALVWHMSFFEVKKLFAALQFNMQLTKTQWLKIKTLKNLYFVSFCGLIFRRLSPIIWVKISATLSQLILRWSIRKQIRCTC